MVRALTEVYNDIREHSIAANTNFAEGWLCPVYKKGDCSLARNYRPIMVLNMDYKIFTKAISRRISKVAPKIIHHDQAGFMTGRRIQDQMELAHLMIRRCKETNQNGVIVCLD